MPKEQPESLDKTRDKQPKPKEKAQEKPEPLFATPEELAEKQQLLQALKQAEKDDSVEGLEKQKEILIKMEELAQKREERIAVEKGEQFDAATGIFTNIRFKETEDKKTGITGYISRHAGRPLVVLVGMQDPAVEFVPNKPYKARVEKISGKRVIYVRIIE